MRTPLALSLLSLCLVVAACDKAEDKKTDDKKADKKGDDKKAEEPAPEPAPEPEKPKVEMVEHDLSSADPEWAGWVAQGPKEAKVMADGVKGARIAADGMDGFDLAFAPKKQDLAALKSSLEKGVEASEGKMKITWTNEAEDALEWTSEGYGSTSYNFVIHMTVGEREVTCKNNYMMGISSKEALEMHKEACKTLAKKGE